jgi:Na+/H+-translocating membrane pyrophosphatase
MFSTFLCLCTFISNHFCLTACNFQLSLKLSIAHLTVAVALLILAVVLEVGKPLYTMHISTLFVLSICTIFSIYKKCLEAVTKDCNNSKNSICSSIWSTGSVCVCLEIVLWVLQISIVVGASETGCPNPDTYLMLRILFPYIVLTKCVFAYWIGYFWHECGENENLRHALSKEHASTLLCLVYGSTMIMEISYVESIYAHKQYNRNSDNGHGEEEFNTDINGTIILNVLSRCLVFLTISVLNRKEH